MVKTTKHFIGVDLSLTGTGAVVLDEDAKILTQHLVVTKPVLEIEVRFKFIVDELDFCWKAVNVDEVYIEGLSFGSRGSSMLESAGLHYIFRYELHRKETKFKIIPPTSLKKWATGKGQAKKELMLLKCYKRFGVEFEDNNLCDAYLLARMSLEENKHGQKQILHS